MKKIITDLHHNKLEASELLAQLFGNVVKQTLQLKKCLKSLNQFYEKYQIVFLYLRSKKYGIIPTCTKF